MPRQSTSPVGLASAPSPSASRSRSLLPEGTWRAVRADWSVSDIGAWPESWPKELEPLRQQAGTSQGNLLDLVIHRIPFTKREEFEAAWPHLLRIKIRAAPVVLVKSPHSHWHFGETAAGVIIHCPPGGKEPARDSGQRPAGPTKATRAAAGDADYRPAVRRSQRAIGPKKIGRPGKYSGRLAHHRCTPRCARAAAR
jgi:hypothetical protein